MAREQRHNRDDDQEERGYTFRRGRRKRCRLCMEKVKFVDYKDVATLRNFMTERGKILARRVSGNCAKHQRQITSAVKRSRNIALLPFTT